MSIAWLPFLAALLLLLPPVGVFHGDRVHFRAISRSWNRHWSQIVSLRFHLLDLLRAALGGWMLALATKLAEPAPRAAAAALATSAVVLGLAVALQALVCKAPRATHAPFAFVSGLVLGCCPPTVAAFALTLAVVLSAGTRLPALFFPLLALFTLASGILFLGKGAAPRLAVIAGAVVLPSLLALMFSRHFVVSYLARPASRPAGSAHAPELR